MMVELQRVISSMSIDLDSQRVAVTGATGFIGLHLLRHLHRAGAQIIVVTVEGRSQDPLNTVDFPFERVSCSGSEGLGRTITQIAPDFVVHLSGHVSTERSLKAIELTLQTNLLATISLLSACAELKTKRVILFGSGEEYGQNPAPFETNVMMDPPSPYAASKAAATSYARMFYNSFGLQTVVLRPSVAYGPGQRPRMLIPAVMSALAAGRNVDVTAGKQLRDFIYIDDVCDAVLLALTLPNVAGRVWNVGSGEIVTVCECLERIERMSGTYGLINYGGRPYNDKEIFHYEPRVEGTWETFHWKPVVMLQEGLERTWQAFKDLQSKK